MTPTKTDSEDVEERVERLLRAAGEALRQLGEDADAEGDEEAGAGDDEAADSEASDVDQRRALEEIAAEVDDLVSNADTARLVSAAGVELPEDASPDSIPEAIARSDSSSLVDLRYLLLLSRLADREGEDADDVVDDLRELPRERAAEESAPTETEADESDESDDADAEAAEGSETDGDTAEAEEAEAEAGEASDAEASEAEADAEEAESEDRFEEFESEIESRLRDSIDGFREQIEAGRSELRDQFGDEESESAEAEAGEDGGEAAEAEAEDAEAEAADGADADEDAEETAGEESDDGLFGGFGGGETRSGRSTSGNRKQTFSTIPSKERADMKQPTRLSTLRLESRDEDED